MEKYPQQINGLDGENVTNFFCFAKRNFRTVNVCVIVELRVQFVFKIDLGCRVSCSRSERQLTM